LNFSKKLWGHGGVLVFASLLVGMIALSGLFAFAAEKKGTVKPRVPKTEEKIRTLEGYVEQEKPFYDYLLKNHPIFQYEKAGRLVGKYRLSDRLEEFVEFGGGDPLQEEIPADVPIGRIGHLLADALGLEGLQRSDAPKIVVLVCPMMIVIEDKLQGVSRFYAECEGQKQ
jgi:hypothetical protein